MRAAHTHVESRRSRPATAWQVARLGARDSVPAAGDWIPASVPGAVQLDWARARGLPDPYYGSNVRAYGGLEDSYWLYRTQIPRVAHRSNERLVFACAGVDYECEVRIGGTHALSHRGIYTPFEIDVSLVPPGTALEVLLFPAPKRHALPADRSQASHVTKPAVSYGWDWHPRLIPLGLCEQAGFEVRPRVHLRHVDFAYTLSEDLSSAELRVSVESSDPAARHTWRLSDPQGGVAAEGRGPGGRLENPRLWWTHDHGGPALYTLEVTLAGEDTVRRKVGFRRVRLVMYPGQWDADNSMPKSRDKPPVTFELNGRRIFAKGSNWVCPDIFHGRVDAGTYRPLLELARGAHFNLLRCWGGAPAPREEFFEMCDEMGLLVWQEFPLACNLYPDDPAYLETLERESRALIRRVRQHPCLGLWVGGNELFNSWSRMTDQSLPLRLLNRNCYDLDPLTPFLPTSPIEGLGHGDYRFRNRGLDAFEIFQRASCNGYPEFGCPGASPVEYLRTFIPPEELWPPREGTSWEVHHGLRGWEGDANSWLFLNTLEDYFGPSASLEQMVSRSTWLQVEGYRSLFEEARRQQPRCSMALSWCYNEPWPSAANNSIVNWPARPKPSYGAVQAACRPVLASARIPRFQWRAGETFTAELWMLNDSAEALPGGTLTAELVLGAGRSRLSQWTFPGLAPQENLRGPAVSMELPGAAAAEFVLELSVSPRADWSSTYRLSLRAAGLPPLPK
jgi:beta-mannosidase